MSENNEINGIVVKDLQTLARALNYLSKDYNDGEIHLNLTNEKLCVTFRSTTIPTGKWATIRDNPYIEVTYVGVNDGKAYIEVMNKEKEEE